MNSIRVASCGAILATLALLFAGNARAACADRSISASAVRTPQDIKAFVLCANEFLGEVGFDAAYDAFHNDSRWRSGPIYVFVTELIPDGTKARSLLHAGKPSRETTHPSMLGDRIDQFGTDIIPEGVRIINTNGSGFWYYGFVNPATGNAEPKVSFIVPVDWRGTPAFMGAGIYRRDFPGACHSDAVNASVLDMEPSDDRLEEFVRCASYILEREGYFATTQFTRDPRWRSGSIYLFGIDTMGNQVFSGRSIKVNGVAVREWASSGTPMDQFGGRDMPAVVDTFGESYLYYRTFDPAGGAYSRKVSFVKRVTAAGVPILLGAGYYLD